MWKLILSGIVSALGLMAAWPKRQSTKALKNYNNWRAGYEMRKADRRQHAALIKSVDERVRNAPNKPNLP